MLEFGDPLFAAAGGRAEFIERLGMAVANDAAVLELGGWFIDEGSVEGFDEIREFLNLGEKLGVKTGGLRHG